MLSYCPEGCKDISAKPPVSEGQFLFLDERNLNLNCFYSELGGRVSHFFSWSSTCENKKLVNTSRDWKNYVETVKFHKLKNA